MPKKPFEQLSLRQKRRIHKICLELLAANGYHHTSVKMITKRLKVADGYLHYYFQGKEDLFKWAIENGLDQWVAHFKEHVEGHEPRDLYELFKMTILQMIRFTRDHRDVFLAYMRLINDPSFPLVAYLAEKISWIDKLYVEAIEKEMENGNLRKDIPPELVAFLVDVLNTRIQEFYWNAALDPLGLSSMTGEQLDAWLDKLLSVVKYGITANEKAS
jgi:AcrR family transcriptional regulator